MCVERRSKRHGVARPAHPQSVAAAVSEASLMSNEDLIRAEAMPVGAPGRGAGDPLPVRRLNQLAGIWHALNAIRGAYLADRKSFLF
jgi:hypothetical protein